MNNRDLFASVSERIQIVLLRHKEHELFSDFRKLFNKFLKEVRKPGESTSSYHYYIDKSQLWKDKKAELYKIKEKKCEKCGSLYNLQVHHLTYDRLYNEDLTDLQVLCGGCHQKEHNLVKNTKVKKKKKVKNKGSKINNFKIKISQEAKRENHYYKQINFVNLKSTDLSIDHIVLHKTYKAGKVVEIDDETNTVSIHFETCNTIRKIKLDHPSSLFYIVK